MNRPPAFSRRQALAGLAAVALGPAWAAGRHHIFAASSLKPALDKLFDRADVALNFAGSGLLARQIGVGAPAALFMSANPLWMDEVEPLTVAGTRRDLLGNRLVLVGRGAVKLSDIPRGTKVVTGLTNAVPLGQYAREAMETLGVWERLSPSLVQVENARLAVTLVERGEVDFGLVYGSDVSSLDKVDVIEKIPTGAHSPIRYPVALIEERSRFVYDMLFTPEARSIFEASGFEVL